MTLKKSILFLIFFSSFFASAVFAQGKVEGNVLRLKGGLFYGTLKTDIEKRTTFAGYFSRELNQDWENTRGLSLLNNLGADYFHSLGGGLLSNAFFGLQLNGFSRDYAWRSFYPLGVGIKEGTYSFNYNDLNFGVTLSLADNFRILPKYVLRVTEQKMNGTYLGLGSPAYFGTQSVTSTGMSGLIGAGFEYDLTSNVTLFADVLVYGPFLIRGRGKYDSELIVLSDSGASYGVANGGYMFSSQKLSVGGNYEIIPKLRIFASFDQERMDTKGESPTAFVLTTGGIDTLASVGQYLGASNEERIKVSGAKFGLTYDLGM